MKKLSCAVALALLSPSLATLPAAAGPPGSDLVPTIVAPASTPVGDPARIEVRVANRGNRDSQSVTLVVQLPTTHTSPNVYTLGYVNDLSQGCTYAGTRITCAMPSIRRGTTASRSFYLALPYSVAPIALGASVTTGNDTNTGNNNASQTITQSYWNVQMPAQAVTLENLHCTGHDLISYFECELFPSSISGHLSTFTPSSPTTGTMDFNANGPGYQSYGGTYSIAGSELTFQITETGVPVANFVGRGVDQGCWEGKTTFTSGGESMYRVCF